MIPGRLDYARETRPSNLRRIPSPKSKRVRRTWITSLVTDCSALVSLNGLRLQTVPPATQTVTGDSEKSHSKSLGD